MRKRFNDKTVEISERSCQAAISCADTTSGRLLTVQPNPSAILKAQAVTKMFTTRHVIKRVTKAIPSEPIPVCSRSPFGRRDKRIIRTDDGGKRYGGSRRSSAQARYLNVRPSDRLPGFFGRGLTQGGHLNITPANVIHRTGVFVARGAETDASTAGDVTRLPFDIWLQNQRGERLTIGTAGDLTSANASKQAIPFVAPHFEVPVEHADHVFAVT